MCLFLLSWQNAIICSTYHGMTAQSAICSFSVRGCTTVCVCVCVCVFVFVCVHACMCEARACILYTLFYRENKIHLVSLIMAERHLLLCCTRDDTLRLIDLRQYSITTTFRLASRPANRPIHYAYVLS